jgi:hypothetical protein
LILNYDFLPFADAWDKLVTQCYLRSLTLSAVVGYCRSLSVVQQSLRLMVSEKVSMPQSVKQPNAESREALNKLQNNHQQQSRS